MKLRKRCCILLALFLAASLLLPLGASAQTRLTLTDLVIMARYVTRQAQLTPEQLAEYDLSGDGAVTLADLVRAAQALTSGEAAAPALRPDYDQVLYTRNDVTVTVGDMTQVGYLVAGALNGRKEVNLTEGVPYDAMIAGLTCLHTLASKPDEYPVAGPVTASLLPAIGAVMSGTETMDGTVVLPRQKILDLAKSLFGSTMGLNGQNLQPSQCTVPVLSDVPVDVSLVQFSRFYHSTLGLAIFDVTIDENDMGLAADTMRIGMQIEVTMSKPFRIIGVERLEPGELIEDNGFASIVVPEMVPAS